VRALLAVTSTNDTDRVSRALLSLHERAQLSTLALAQVHSAQCVLRIM
jgi:hypothetical protein